MAVLLPSDAVLVCSACYIILDQSHWHVVCVVFLLRVDICIWPLAAAPLLRAQPLLALGECWWDGFVKQGCVSARCPPKPAFNLISSYLNKTIPSRTEQCSGAWHRLSTHSLLHENWCLYCPQRDRVEKAPDLVPVQEASLGFSFSAPLPRVPWLAPCTLWSLLSTGQEPAVSCACVHGVWAWAAFVLINQVRIAGCCLGAGGVSQVCGDAWHHRTLSFSSACFSTASLYKHISGGQKFQNERWLCNDLLWITQLPKANLFQLHLQIVFLKQDNFRLFIVRAYLENFPGCDTLDSTYSWTRNKGLY